MSITFERVSYTYQPGTPFEWQAISDIDLRITPGRFWGIIGSTGSGKSTLIQHMNGLLHPTSGRVLVDGVDLAAKGTDLKTIRHKVGLVFQYAEHQLFGETVYEDIAFGPRNLGLAAPEVDRRVQVSMERVGLAPELASRSPFGLSGGQARRVALAGVLAMEPQILVLDEPTAGLDPQGRGDLFKMIRSLPAHGMTVVLVSHSMDDVAQFADQVVVMHQGRMAMQGAPSELFARRAELEGMGLGVPAAAQLADLLRQRGWDLPSDLVTQEATVDAIARALGKGGGRR